VVRDANGSVVAAPRIAYGYSEADKQATEARKLWDQQFKAQNPQTGAWDYGNCSNCKNSRKRPVYSTGRAMIPQAQEVEVGYPIWPEGARFDSRFGGGCTCGLCGKTILKSNLVPVHAIGSDGRAHAMCVGSDCALKFLAIKKPAKKGVQIEVG
jgi:hypothetical protein